MARLKIAYIGGGSTRGAGTMASFIEQGENFSGSEIVLVDLNEERLELIGRLGAADGRDEGRRPEVTATTDRRGGLEDCDAVLTSYRPGGFEARVLDERIPLSHGVIGQETQGPGGFFMALRSIHVMQGILDDIAVACPGARIFNYTNPVNIVAQAVTDHTDIPFVSLCEGPIVFPEMIAEAAGLDPALLDVASVGLNHGSWSVRHHVRRRDLLPLLQEAYARRAGDPSLEPTTRRMLRLASAMGAVPSEYFQYYYFEDEVLRELSDKPTTRAEDILGWVPGYWDHYVEQAGSDSPQLDPGRSRGGINELELAIDCMDAVFNDRGETLPVNVPNAGSIPGLPGHARRRDARRAATRTASGRCRCRGCRRTFGGWSRRWGSTSRRPPTRRGRATPATRCARSPPTRSSGRSTSPSGSTPRWRSRTATTCRRGSCPPERRRLSGPRAARPRGAGTRAAPATAPRTSARAPSTPAVTGIWRIASMAARRTAERSGSSSRSPACASSPPTTTSSGASRLHAPATAIPSARPASPITSRQPWSPVRASSMTRGSVSLSALSGARSQSLFGSPRSGSAAPRGRRASSWGSRARGCRRARATT